MVVLRGISPSRLLTSGAASTSSSLTSPQKFSGIQRHFFWQLSGVRSPWPSALPSPKPFSSGKLSGFMLPCRGSWNEPLLRALLNRAGASNV